MTAKAIFKAVNMVVKHFSIVTMVPSYNFTQSYSMTLSLTYKVSSGSN